MDTTEAARRTDRGLPGQPFSHPSRHVCAVSLWLLSLVLFRQSLIGLARLSFQDERSSHLLLIPLMSACFLFLQRKTIFQCPRWCPSIGVALILAAAVSWFALRTPLSRLDNADRLSGAASTIVLAWIGVFILSYGMGAFKAGAFPLLFLLLMIPLPIAFVDKFVSWLQKGSAETCYALFRLVGVPFVRHGFQFSLPGVDIEVAEQCSGIHSALALFIAGLLLQHVLLKGPGKKIFFVLCIVPIAIFKNALRIVTIAWLGIHVNADFFHGQLHKQGGLPFAALAMLMLGILLWLLRRPQLNSKLAGTEM
jgi:exosortase